IESSMQVHEVLHDRIDGSAKLILRAADGALVHAVAFRAVTGWVRRERDAGRDVSDVHVCYSAQVGCAYDCALICATARMGLVRNLTAVEVAGQLHTALAFAREHFADDRPMSVHCAGMGGFGGNYRNVIDALLATRDVPAIGNRSLSTIGHVTAIRALALASVKYALHARLFASCHGGTDEVRERVIPRNRVWPLRKVLAAAHDYARSTRTTFQASYLLVPEVGNDTPEQIDALAAQLDPELAEVMVLLHNPVDGLHVSRVSDGAAERAAERFRTHGLRAYTMPSSGGGVNAACGQLTEARR
ncbi:MAG: hypothetical protein ACRCZP_01325, partial [Phycicoccus sp.]